MKSRLDTLEFSARTMNYLTTDWATQQLDVEDKLDVYTYEMEVMLWQYT